jgi:hypothetical protein
MVNPTNYLVLLRLRYNHSNTISPPLLLICNHSNHIRRTLPLLRLNAFNIRSMLLLLLDQLSLNLRVSLSTLFSKLLRNPILSLFQTMHLIQAMLSN